MWRGQGGGAGGSCEMLSILLKKGNGYVKSVAPLVLLPDAISEAPNQLGVGVTLKVGALEHPPAPPLWAHPASERS